MYDKHINYILYSSHNNCSARTNFADYSFAVQGRWRTTSVKRSFCLTCSKIFNKYITAHLVHLWHCKNLCDVNEFHNNKTAISLPDTNCDFGFFTFFFTLWFTYLQQKWTNFYFLVYLFVATWGICLCAFHKLCHMFICRPMFKSMKSNFVSFITMTNWYTTITIIIWHFIMHHNTGSVTISGVASCGVLGHVSLE